MNQSPSQTDFAFPPASPPLLAKRDRKSFEGATAKEKKSMAALTRSLLLQEGFRKTQTIANMRSAAERVEKDKVEGKAKLFKFSKDMFGVASDMLKSTFGYGIVASDKEMAFLTNNLPPHLMSVAFEFGSMGDGQLPAEKERIGFIVVVLALVILLPEPTLADVKKHLLGMDLPASSNFKSPTALAKLKDNGKGKLDDGAIEALLKDLIRQKYLEKQDKSKAEGGRYEVLSVGARALLEISNAVVLKCVTALLEDPMPPKNAINAFGVKEADFSIPQTQPM